MGVLAIFGAAVFFAAGIIFDRKEGIGMRYVRLTGTLIFGSVPLYLEHSVPESDLSKDRIPVRGRGAVGGVCPVSHRAWEGQMAVFSGYVECKGHSAPQ